MPHRDRRTPAGRGATGSGRDAAARQEAQGWFVRTPVDFLDQRLNPMSDRDRYVHQVLDGFARDAPYCFPGNDDLVNKTGKSLSAIQEILSELEARGVILRVMGRGPRAGRIGILLLKRVDPDRPAADTPERRDAAEAALRARRGAERAPEQGPEIRAPGARISGRGGARISGRGGARKSGPELESLSLRPNEKTHATPTPGTPGPDPNPDEGPYRAPTWDDIPDDTDPRLATTEEAWAAIEATSPTTATLLRGFLAEGGPRAISAQRTLINKRYALAGLRTPAESGPWGGAKAVDKMLPGELSFVVRRTIADSAAGQGTAATTGTAAMLARLHRGCPRYNLDLCVARLCREFRDGHSQRYYTVVCDDVRAGARSAESLVHAYEQACGPGIKNPGAAFVAALKRHDLGADDA